VPFRDRVLRDERFELYLGTNRRAQKMVRVGVEGRKEGIVRPEDAPNPRQRTRSSKKVVAESPEKDANRRY